MLCMQLAPSALFLGDHGSPLYRPNTPISQVHIRISNLAKSFISYQPRSIDDLDLLLAMTTYFVSSGQGEDTTELGETALALAEQQGFLDEGLPSWSSLSDEERHNRRSVAWAMVSSFRQVVTLL